MGRKKSKRSAPKKAFKAKLEKTFACPFCNHESTIECKLDRQRQIGTIACRICSAGYQTVINYLSEPVDVYGEWIDAIEAQELKRKEAGAGSRGGNDEESEEENAPASRTKKVLSKKVKKAEEEEEDSGPDSESEDAEFTEDDLVDYKEMTAADRKRSKTAGKKTNKKSKGSSSSSESESSDPFGSDSESEAAFSDSED